MILINQISRKSGFNQGLYPEIIMDYDRQMMKDHVIINIKILKMHKAKLMIDKSKLIHMGSQEVYAIMHLI